MRVTTSFVRNFRKAFLDHETGEVLPGFEDIARVLLTIHKALQGGAYAYAIETGKKHGLDLENMYVEHIAAQKLGGKWRGVESALRKWGTQPRFLDMEKGISDVKQTKFSGATPFDGLPAVIPTETAIPRNY